MEFPDIRSAMLLPKGEMAVMYSMGSAFLVFRGADGRLWQGARLWPADYLKEDLRPPEPYIPTEGYELGN